MLKMNCPICQHEIVSPLLSECRHVVCPACKQEVRVKNIIVYSNGLSCHRDQLRTKLYHYKDLLAAAYRDKKQRQDTSDSHFQNNTRSEQFIVTLQELMAGARDNYRATVDDYFVTYRSHHLKGFARLLNLSVAGACIQSTTDASLPCAINQELILSLAVPGRPDALTITGRVSWSWPAESPLKKHRVGVQFVDLEQQAKTSLLNFIEQIRPHAVG